MNISVFKSNSLVKNLVSRKKIHALFSILKKIKLLKPRLYIYVYLFSMYIYCFFEIRNAKTINFEKKSTLWRN